MAYIPEREYYFKPYRGNSDMWLNRKGTGPIQPHSNATLYSATGDPDQRLRIHIVNGGCQLQSALDYSYGLNIIQNNCDFYPIAGNEQDALIDLMTIDAENDLYRVKMINHNLFLTPDGNYSGANLMWKPATGGNEQVWKLCETQDEVPSTGGKQLDIPYSYNMKYDSDPWIRSQGCAVCGAIPVSAYWAKHHGVDSSYTPADFKDAGFYTNANGFGWRAHYVTFENYTGPDISDETLFRIVKTEIDAGCPVMLHIRDTAQKNEHWVTAYGYKNNCTNRNDVLVLDPFNPNASDSQARKCTFNEAIAASHNCTIWDRLEKSRYSNKYIP